MGSGQEETRARGFATAAVLTLPATPAPTRAAGASPGLGSCPLFPADNVWNTRIDSLPVDANSVTYVNTIGASRTILPDFGAAMWEGGPIGIPYISVPQTQPRVPVTFDYDDESAPEASLPIIKGALGASGQLPNFIGVLAGAPAALRAYTRMRHELRAGSLPMATRERISLAVAERRGDPYSIAQHARTARNAGLGLDEVSKARTFRSGDEKEAALLVFLEALLATDGRPSAHLGEEAREAGWTDEQILEAVAFVALNEFQSLIANAAALPQDQTDPSILPQAA